MSPPKSQTPEKTPHTAASDAATEVKKKGRPAKGEPVLVRLSDVERVVAQELGDGVVAQGIRIALNAAAQLGKTSTLLLSRQSKNKE